MNLNRTLGAALILATTAFPLIAGPAAALSSGLSLSSSSSSAPETNPTTGYLGYLDLAEATWAPGLDEELAAAPLGGLSGIEHVEDSHYIAISDDPAQRGPARAYHLDLTFDGQGMASGATITDIIEFTDAEGRPFPESSVDPESLRVLPDGNLLWTSEGFAREGDFRAPQVFISDPSGRVLDELAVPAHHTPDPGLSTGIRHNNANEGLSLSADGGSALTLNEGALQQDGPANTGEHGTRVRLTTFDLATGVPTAEYAVEVGPRYPGAVDRGMTELLSVGDGSFLVLERGFIPGSGNRAEIYRITLDGATNVLDTPALTGEETPVNKKLVLSFDDNAEHPDNVEGLAWGPQLADGGRSLLVISDDNFNDTQRSLLHTVAVYSAQAAK